MGPWYTRYSRQLCSAGRLIGGSTVPEEYGGGCRATTYGAGSTRTNENYLERTQMSVACCTASAEAYRTKIQIVVTEPRAIAGPAVVLNSASTINWSEDRKPRELRAFDTSVLYKRRLRSGTWIE